MVTGNKNLRGCPDTELSDTSKIYSLPLMISIVGLLAPSNLKIFTPPTLATVTTKVFSSEFARCNISSDTSN